MSRIPGLHNRKPGLQTVALVTVLLVLGAGFCLFESHNHAADDHGSSPDLCLGMLVGSLVAIMLIRPLLSGWAGVDLPALTVLTALYVLDPPPRAPSRLS